MLPAICQGGRRESACESGPRDKEAAVGSHANASTAPPIGRPQTDRARGGIAAAIVVLVGLLLAIWASAASAAPSPQPGWAFSQRLVGIPSNVIEPTRTPIALDGSGNIFTSEAFSGISTFDPTGEGAETIPAYNSRNLAIDPVDGAIYVD